MSVLRSMPVLRVGRRARVAALATTMLVFSTLGLAAPSSARPPAHLEAPTAASVWTGPSDTADTAPVTGTGQAQVWSTTGDASARMSPVGSFPASTTPSATTLPTITVDTTVRQSVTGFGAAVTHSSAALLAGLPAEKRRALLTQLFAPDGPVRLSVVRIPLGGSDFVVGKPSTFDDTVGNVADWSLSKFSTAADGKVLRPILREIRAINPTVTFVAAPWSAPAWMKTTKHLNAGALSTDKRAVGTYATYLTRALLEYRNLGVPISFVSVQNEPQTRSWGDYPRMEMPVATQVAVINALVPKMRAAGLGTKVLGFDHNWTQHPADVAATPAGTDPELDYPARVLRSSAGPLVSGTAFHCYSGDASAQEPIHTQFPTKSIWVTECSGSHAAGASQETIFADTVYWQSKNLMIASLRHWATAVVTWNLALDASGGPHTGGCDTCTGVVTIQDGTVTPNAEFYVLAQAARFIPRGSVRVDSASSSSALDQVAFRAPNGTTTVLVHHSGWPARALTVRAGGRSYDVTVPAWSLSTITIAP